MSAAFVAEVGTFCAAARRRQLRGPAACARRAAELLRLLVANGRHADPCSLIADVRRWGAEMQAAAPLGEDAFFVKRGGCWVRKSLLRALADWVMREKSHGWPRRVSFSSENTNRRRPMMAPFVHSLLSFFLLNPRPPRLQKKNRALHRQYGPPRPPHDPRGER